MTEPRTSAKKRWALTAGALALLLGALSTRTGSWLTNDASSGVALQFFHAPPLGPMLLGPQAAETSASADACVEGRGLVFPTGELPQLTCEQARKVIAQARNLLATPAEPIDPARFAAATSDWLDPHGLWSVAPDAPVAPLLSKVSARLIQELESAPGGSGCGAASEVGASLSQWVGELRTVADAARELAKSQSIDARTRWELASNTPFEDGTVSRRARDLSRLLGHGAGGVERGYGSALTPFAKTAIDRTLPNKPAADWERVVLAAAVRAYLPQLDPHGAWAPLDEETSIYDLDLEVDPPPRLWSEMTRTTLGIRVDAGARAPLKVGDVVLQIGAVDLGGLSVEQANQLAIMPDGDPIKITLLRGGAVRPQSLEANVDVVLLSPPPAARELSGLSFREIGYGSGQVLVVRIPDVPDDLGERLASALFEHERAHEPLGVLLDLRGNGGGSTDGAEGALALFLPGAALFPMKRRDGEIEVDRAPRPAKVWRGPVATLVDGDSASAAEMLAGALLAYERGTVVGTRTYGKGCAQEYLDDDSGVGVLRLTTLVFSLPDGSPLQRVGVSPVITLGLPRGGEQEALLSHAPSTWRGPDVRDRGLIGGVAWPDHGGRVGDGSDQTVYRALRALGATRAAAR